MPQLGVWNNIYQSSRCAFSAAFNQQLQHQFRTGASLAEPSEGMLCSAPSPSPQHPLALLPQPHGTEDSRAQECEGAARPQQRLCPQFLTFSLLQAQHLKLCLCCCIPEAPGAFTSTKHQRDKKCSAATSEQNKSIFLPVSALTAPSKREGNFWTRQD